MLAENLDRPSFESLLKAGVIKLFYNNSYRVCTVDQVSKEMQPYELTYMKNPLNKGHKGTPSDKISTNLEIICSFANQKKKFKMSMVSNQKI